MSKAKEMLMKNGFSESQAAVVVAQLKKREGNKDGNSSETAAVNGSVVHTTD